MYWSVVGDNEFDINDPERGVLFFSSLTTDEKEAFLNYELTVYFCTGTDKEKLDWFRVINIAGERLLDQELLNAVYVGPFVTDARRYFSKNGCPAYKIGGDYLNGNAIEQAYLATILRWAARKEGIKEVSEYMSKHKDDANANQLWAYFSAIITWVRTTFTTYRKEMKGIDWGLLFATFHSVHSTRNRNAKPTNAKAASVLGVATTSIWKRWRATTLFI